LQTDVKVGPRSITTSYQMATRSQNDLMRQLRLLKRVILAQTTDTQATFTKLVYLAIYCIKINMSFINTA